MELNGGFRRLIKKEQEKCVTPGREKVWPFYAFGEKRIHQMTYYLLLFDFWIFEIPVRKKKKKKKEERRDFSFVIASGLMIVNNSKGSTTFDPICIYLRRKKLNENHCQFCESLPDFINVVWLSSFHFQVKFIECQVGVISVTNPANVDDLGRWDVLSCL